MPYFGRPQAVICSVVWSSESIVFLIYFGNSGILEILDYFRENGLWLPIFFTKFFNLFKKKIFGLSVYLYIEECFEVFRDRCFPENMKRNVHLLPSLCEECSVEWVLTRALCHGSPPSVRPEAWSARRHQGQGVQASWPGPETVCSAHRDLHPGPPSQAHESRGMHSRPRLHRLTLYFTPVQLYKQNTVLYTSTTL